MSESFHQNRGIDQEAGWSLGEAVREFANLYTEADEEAAALATTAGGTKEAQVRHDIVHALYAEMEGLWGLYPDEIAAELNQAGMDLSIQRAQQRTNY